MKKRSTSAKMLALYGGSVTVAAAGMVAVTLMANGMLSALTAQAQDGIRSTQDAANQYRIVLAAAQQYIDSEDERASQSEIDELAQQIAELNEELHRYEAENANTSPSTIVLPDGTIARVLPDGTVVDQNGNPLDYNGDGIIDETDTNGVIAYMDDSPVPPWVGKDENGKAMVDADGNYLNADGTVIKRDADGNWVSPDGRLTLSEDGTLTYHIMRGDTLTGISYYVNLPRDQLAEVNRIKDINVIYAGDTLEVPMTDFNGEWPVKANVKTGEEYRPKNIK